MFLYLCLLKNIFFTRSTLQAVRQLASGPRLRIHLPSIRKSAALDCARPTLLEGKFSDVTSPVNQAKAQFDNGTIAALDRAIVDLEAAALALREETTWDMTPENCAGDALARINNLIWRAKDLIVAQ